MTTVGAARNTNAGTESIVFDATTTSASRDAGTTECARLRLALIIAWNMRKHLRRAYEGARAREDEVAGCGEVHQGHDVRVPSLSPSYKELRRAPAD